MLIKKNGWYYDWTKLDEIAIKQVASYAYSNYQVWVHTPMSDLVAQKPPRYNGKKKSQGVGYWYGHRQLWNYKKTNDVLTDWLSK